MEVWLLALLLVEKDLLGCIQISKVDLNDSSRLFGIKPGTEGIASQKAQKLGYYIGVKMYSPPKTPKLLGNFGTY